MKIQLLPNYFKTIGFTLFIIFMIPSSLISFMEGFNGYPIGFLKDQIILNGFLGIKITNSFLTVTEILSIVGLVICMISKEKILDEFLIKLRMESVQLAFYISLLVVLLMVTIKQDWKIDASYLLYPQIIGYFIIYKIKKSLINES